MPATCIDMLIVVPQTTNMNKHVLFIHGAGQGAYEEDGLLVASLQNALGSAYDVRYPKMLNEESPEYADWKAQKENLRRIYMSKLTSKDGTTIAYDKKGQGPAIVLVDGALCYRGFGPSEPLAGRLARDFTIYTYDRRGRGESSDTLPYAVEREIEDIEALIEEAGGSVYLYGISSGAVLALKAAAKLGPARVPKLALYEAPLDSGDDKAKQDFAQYTQRMAELLEANQRGDAVAFFMADMIPPEMIEGMKQSPEWPLMEAVAHTLAYDNAVMGDGSVPTDDAKAATMPALVLDGSESPAFLHEAAETLAKAMPYAERKTLEGQTHMVSPEALAPVLEEFFAE